MHAAVVTSFDTPPRYQEFPDPVAGPGQVVVDVVAAAVHPLVISLAAGAHYSRTGVPPLVPGIDAVVRDPDGRLLYALVRGSRHGTMAERTVVEPRNCVPLPPGADPVIVAAALNPVMSSWVALRHRVRFEPGQRVLVTGATGSAGRAAVQVAKLFGAGEVVAAGRNPVGLADLTALGADRTISLGQFAEAADVDVVLDYLWGEPAATGLVDLLTARTDRSRPLTWIQIGSVAGATCAIPSAALRSTNLTLLGSGIGSVGSGDYVHELGQIVEAVGAGRFAVRAHAVPLAEVERHWTPGTGERIVLTP